VSQTQAGERGIRSDPFSRAGLVQVVPSIHFRWALRVWADQDSAVDSLLAFEVFP
jgi:hypothetical protein